MNAILRSSSLIAFAGLLAACGTEAPETPEAPLTLSAHTSELVAGTWSEGQQTLDFELARTAEKMSLRLAPSAGAERLVLTVDQAEQRFEINGRRVSIDPATAGFMLEGEGMTLAELGATPEVARLQELRRVLAEAGVEGQLLEVVPEPAFFDVSLRPERPLTFSACHDRCSSDFGWSYALAVVFAPWLVPTVIQIYHSCMVNCG